MHRFAAIMHPRLCHSAATAEGVSRWLLQGPPGHRCFAGISGKTQLDSGKHKGKTFEEAAVDEKFCQSLLKKKDHPEHYRQFVTYLQENQTVESSSDGAPPRETPHPTSDSSSGASSSGGDQVISFGKHKGTTFADLQTKHPDYCKWLVNKSKEEPDKQPNAFVRWLLARDGQSADPPAGAGASGSFAPRTAASASAPSAGGDQIIPFGKHKGKTFEELASKEPGYVQWLVKQAKEEPDKKPSDFVAWFLETRGEAKPRFGGGGGFGGGGFGGGGGGGGARSWSNKPQPKEDGPLEGGEWTVAFGKHSGKTFNEIYNTDRQYLEWLTKDVCTAEKTSKTSIALALFMKLQDGKRK